MYYQRATTNTVLLLFLLFGLSNKLNAGIFYSTTNGNWATGSTWVSGSAPGVSDTVYIQAGDTVTITGSAYTHTGSLIIEDGGKLIADCGDSSNGLTLNGNDFHVFGELELTFPDKDLRLRGNTFFWAHDGAIIFVSDDLLFEDNSVNVLENVCIEVDDDCHIVGTGTSICGSGGASIGTNTGSNTLNYQSGATNAQICQSTNIYRGSGGTCVTVVDGGTSSSNNAPVANDDTNNTDQNVPITIDVLNQGTGDSDADGDPLQIVYATGILASGPTAQGGTVSINNNGTPSDFSDDFIDYTPPPGFTGYDSFVYTISDGNGGFAQATAGVTISAALPVTLVNFEAVEDNCTASIKWTTANEIDNQGFELEKSTDGISWEVIAEINGAGTTSKNTYYQVTDHDLQRQNYYRLKQVDFDGTSTYSVAVFLNANCYKDLEKQEGILSIIPNPVAYQPLQIRYESIKAEEKMMIITDLSGQVLQKTLVEFEQGINSIRIDLNHFPGGTYFLQIGKSYYKFVKMYQ